MNSFLPASTPPIGHPRPFVRQIDTLSQYCVISERGMSSPAAALNNHAPSTCRATPLLNAKSWICFMYDNGRMVPPLLLWVFSKQMALILSYSAYESNSSTSFNFNEPLSFSVSGSGLVCVMKTYASCVKENIWEFEPTMKAESLGQVHKILMRLAIEDEGTNTDASLFKRSATCFSS